MSGQPNLDEVDVRLLGLLRDDARQPIAQLAKELGISRGQLYSRLARLEESGVVDGYTVRLGDAFARSRLRAHVMIKTAPRFRRELESLLSEIVQVSAIHAISGEFDYIAMLEAEDGVELNRLVDEIGMLEGVEFTRSSVILATKLERCNERALPSIRGRLARLRAFPSGGLLAGIAEATRFPGLQVRQAALALRQPFDDRAIGTVVPVAVIRQRLERANHRLDFRNLVLEPLDMLKRDRFHVGAGPAAVRPQPEQFADLLDRKAQVARAPDESQSMHVSIVIVAIPRLLAQRLGDEPGLLVIADHLGRDARQFSGAADVQRASP